MGQRQTSNSLHKPQRSPNEMLGLNQDDHLYRMCNETGIQIPGIPNKILSTRAPYLYINVTHVSSSEEPSRVHYAI